MRGVACGVASVLLLAMLVLLPSACRPPKKESEEGIKKISFLTMQLRPVFDQYFFDRIAEFEALHPDVKIHWLDLPYPSYNMKLVTSFMAEKAPDLINLPSESIPGFVKMGYVQPLDPFVAKKDLDAYVPSLMQDACIFQGRTYGLPWYSSSGVMFCNREILEQAGLDPAKFPRNTDDIPEYSRIIREKTGKYFVFPILMEGPSLRLFLSEASVPLLSEDGKHAAFNTPRGVKVFKFWTDLYRDGLIPSEVLTATHRRPIELFNTGQLAAMANGPQFLRRVKADAPDLYAKMMIAPLMTWKDNHTYIVDLHTFSLSAQSKYPALAAEFGVFLTNAENQLKFAHLTPIIPSVTAALDDPYFSAGGPTLEDEARRISAMQARQGRIYQAMPNPDLARVFEEIMEDVLLKRREAPEALKYAEERWNDILQ